MQTAMRESWTDERLDRMETAVRDINARIDQIYDLFLQASGLLLIAAILGLIATQL